MNWSPDFTVKSNARRAARKAGVDPSKVQAFVKAGKTLFRFPAAAAPRAAKPDKAATRMKKVQAATAARVKKGKEAKAKKPAKVSAPRPSHPASRAARPNAAKTPAQPKAAGERGAKFETVAALLRRPGGASMTEVVAITGWKPHSARARISVDVSKLLGKGEVIDRRRENGVSHYAIVKSKQLDLPIPEAA